MDITQLFKASVMAVKLQRKGQLPHQTPLDKNRILPKPTAKRDEFTKQAKNVCARITALRNILLENRAAYMRIGQHLKNASHMTDEQRDIIDRESEKFFTHYIQHLAQLRADWKSSKRKPQQREHMEGVLDLLSNYLRSVQTVFQEQKKYRVQYELDTYRLLKLAADKKKVPVVLGGEHSGKRPTKLASASYRTSTNENHDSDSSASGIERTDETVLTKANALRRRRRQPTVTNDDNANLVDANDDGKLPAHTIQKVALDDDLQKSKQFVDDEVTEASQELSPEDVQMFEAENVHLYQELQGVTEEVEQIGRNVVDIAQLQDIFTEKVSLQQYNIERIANAVIGATENVNDANEQIKQAIQRNAGLRVWSLFFLLVMSFALLFLDWYYD